MHHNSRYFYYVLADYIYVFFFFTQTRFLNLNHFRLLSPSETYLTNIIQYVKKVCPYLVAFSIYMHNVILFIYLMFFKYKLCASYVIH